MGALSDSNAMAGAVGATVGEIVGEAYATTNPEINRMSSAFEHKDLEYALHIKST